MDKTTLQNKVFSQPFDQTLWFEVLRSVFSARQLFAQPKPIAIGVNDKAEAAYELGSLTTSDDRVIGLYRIDIKPNVWLERNKVGLRELLRSVYKYEVDGAIITFVQGDKWRLSFVSEIKVLNDEGEVIEQATEPKRYTYLLGKDEKVRTPSDRLSKLTGKTLSLKDFLNAFSVEALNEEFYKIIQASFYELVGGKVSKGSKINDFGTGVLQLPGQVKENRHIHQEFAVRLIGRIVFCWFLKMKKTKDTAALLPEALLSSSAVRTNPGYYHFILERLFFQTLNTPVTERLNDLPDGSDRVPFLNGGLFEPGNNDFYKPNALTGFSEYINTLILPDEWFLHFFEELEKYNFTIDENSVTDVEVSVDPEMLGRIFENLLAEIDPDSGETARKATGSFYTPREIVDYMATESLVQYLHNKTGLDQDHLRPLFRMLERELPEYGLSDKEIILDALDKVKILDPACGSGAFPMGVLQKIVQALQKLDPEANWWIERQVNYNAHPTVRQAVREKLSHNPEYARKIGVIQNSLYGVDIQPIAAEISKLRCFLTLIVDENINDALPNRGIEPLPNLEFKFVTGDTLIQLPVDDITGGLFGPENELIELQKVRLDYLQSYGDQKELLKVKFQQIQDKIFKQQLRHGITDSNSRAYLISIWKPFGHEKADWFDSKWMFGVEKFDIAIGNPPYVQLQKDKGLLAKRYSNQGYKTYFKMGDLYLLFLEKSRYLLNENGVLASINPNTWLQSISFSQARKFFVENYDWIKILVTDKVFDATVDTHCLVFSVKKTKNEDVKIYKKAKKSIAYSHSISKNQIDRTGEQINIEITNLEYKLFNKIKSNNNVLANYYTVMTGVKPFQKGKGKPPQTEEVVINKPFVITGSKPNDTWSPLLRGSLMNRYKVLWRNDYWIQYGEWLAEPRDRKYFEKNKKVIVRQTGDSLIASFIGPNYVCRDNLYMITSKCDENIFALIGLLNSKLMNFYYNILNPEKGEALAQVKKKHLDALPLLERSELSKLENIVYYVLQINKIQSTINLHVPNAHIAQLFEEIIDAMVMELYFKEDFEQVGIEFIKYVVRDFKPIEDKTEIEQIEIIRSIYQKLREKDNEIRNNLKLMDIKLAHIVMPIKSIGK